MAKVARERSGQICNLPDEQQRPGAGQWVEEHASVQNTRCHSEHCNRPGLTSTTLGFGINNLRSLISRHKGKGLERVEVLGM